MKLLCSKLQIFLLLIMLLSKYPVVKKLVGTIACIVIVLTLLSLYGYGVQHVSRGGNDLGLITQPLLKFVNAPKKVAGILKNQELRGIPSTFTKLDPDFSPVNTLTYDLYALNTFYNMHKQRWDARLFNLKNDEVIHEWYLTADMVDLGTTKRKFTNSRPTHSLLLPDRSIIIACMGTPNLLRLNENSKTIWHNTERIFHHAMNLDADSNLWACTYGVAGIKNVQPNQVNYYKDEYITQIDMNTGKILYEKSISEILIEHGYAGILYGTCNSMFAERADDPLHLNDIQPVLKDAPYWRKGDVFISVRHRSLIILYRPSQNKIVTILQGPFLNQHDIDIHSDTEISLFNNNAYDGDDPIDRVSRFGSPRKLHQLGPSEILVYNFQDSSYREPFEDHFRAEKIWTWTEGLHEFLSQGDVFVESQNSGKLYIIGEDGVVLKKVFPTTIDGMVETPNWIRIYEDLNFLD